MVKIQKGLFYSFHLSRLSNFNKSNVSLLSYSKMWYLSFLKISKHITNKVIKSKQNSCLNFSQKNLSNKLLYTRKRYFKHLIKCKCNYITLKSVETLPLNILRVYEIVACCQFTFNVFDTDHTRFLNVITFLTSTI